MVNLQEVKRSAKHEKTDNLNQNEVPDIEESPFDQFDVEGCRLEETAPFKNLDPKRNRSKGNDDFLI